MTAREFLTNVTIILAVMALGAVLEVLVPDVCGQAVEPGTTLRQSRTDCRVVSIELAARISRRCCGAEFATSRASGAAGSCRTGARS